MSDRLRQESSGGRRLTITIPEAAERLGIGRNQAYEAARRGEIPVIRIGKRMVVPVLAFERMLGVESKSEMAAELLSRRRAVGQPEVV